MKPPKKTWKERVVPIVAKLQPAARIVERAASVAVHLKKPTVAGVAGVAGTALAALAEQLGNTRGGGRTITMYVSRGQVAAAMEESGANVTYTRYSDGSAAVDVRLGDLRFWINSNGSLYLTHEPGPEFVEWLKQAINRKLTDAIEITRNEDDKGSGYYEARPLRLSNLVNPQADEIMQSTIPLIEGGRCILLDGKPGVGKTTLAQIIARKAGLGRTIVLDAKMIEAADEPFSESTANVREAFKYLSPGVIIVDDVDKVNLSLSYLEALRSASKLVILTANNGQYDEVLDGAMMRAGRVDEVFTIRATKLERSHPFELLSDDEWEEVCQWPVAYVNEVRKRLVHRPADLRLDDLRERLERKTKSKDHLY